MPIRFSEQLNQFVTISPQTKDASIDKQSL